MNNFLRKNLWLKLAALLLALFLWVFVLLRSQSEVSIEAIPQVKSYPAGFCVVDTTPDSVSLVLKGNQRVLSRLAPSDVKVQLALKEARAGRVFVPVKEEDIKAPPHIGLVSVRPPGVWVVLSRNVKVTVPVKPNIIGLPAEGYRVLRIEAFPDKATVECAPRGLKELATEPVDISGLTETLVEEAPVREPDRDLAVTPAQVRVKVTISKSE